MLLQFSAYGRLHEAWQSCILWYIFFTRGNSIYSIFMTWADLFNNEDTVVLRSMVCTFTLGTNWTHM